MANEGPSNLQTNASDNHQNHSHVPSRGSPSLIFSELAAGLELASASERAAALETLTSPSTKEGSPKWQQAFDVVSRYYAYVSVIGERALFATTEMNIPTKRMDEDWSKMSDTFMAHPSGVMHPPGSSFVKDCLPYFDLCDQFLQQHESLETLQDAVTLTLIQNAVSQFITHAIAFSKGGLQLSSQVSNRAEKLGDKFLTFLQDADEDDDEGEGKSKGGLWGSQPSDSLVLSDLGLGDTIQYISEGIQSHFEIVGVVQSVRKETTFIVEEKSKEKELSSEQMEKIIQNGAVLVYDDIDL